MTTVTVHQEGETVGLTFPPDLRDRIGLKAGQRFIVLELPDGLKLLPHDPELERQLDLSETVLTDQADVLRSLASV